MLGQTKRGDTSRARTFVKSSSKETRGPPLEERKTVHLSLDATWSLMVQSQRELSGAGCGGQCGFKSHNSRSYIISPSCFLSSASVSSPICAFSRFLDLELSVASFFDRSLFRTEYIRRVGGASHSSKPISQTFLASLLS